MEIINKRGWFKEEDSWWYYFGKKKLIRSRGIIYKCSFCEKEFPRVPSNNSRSNKCYCSKSCNVKDNPSLKRRGIECPSWRGGRNIIRNGYIEIYSPEHPKARGGKYVREHRLVMEKHLGRYLKDNEQVHHKNGIKDDNRIENLELVTFNDHFGDVTCPCCNFKFKVK